MPVGDEWFVIQAVVNDKYLDVPNSDAKIDVQPQTYDKFTGTHNQMWRWRDNRIVSRIDETMCLGVKGDMKVNAPVTLGKINTHLSEWRRHSGKFFSLSNPDYALTVHQNRLVVRHYLSCTRWRLIPNGPCPATSCALWYGPTKPSDFKDEWKIQVTCKVEATADDTYFGVVGAAPSAYAGLQQLESGKNRNAVFSLWNERDNKVELVEKSPEVIVEQFSGESKGMKAIRPYKWTESEPITFMMSGRRDGDFWEVSCTMKTESKTNKKGEDEYFVATFKRRGHNPIAPGGFYSFIEDYDRTDFAQGYLHLRSATFSEPTLTDANNISNVLHFAKFMKKPRVPAERYGLDRAFACANETEGTFVLSTGGSEVITTTSETELQI